MVLPGPWNEHPSPHCKIKAQAPSCGGHGHGTLLTSSCTALSTFFLARASFCAPGMPPQPVLKCTISFHPSCLFPPWETLLSSPSILLHSSSRATNRHFLCENLPAPIFWFTPKHNPRGEISRVGSICITQCCITLHKLFNLFMLQFSQWQNRDNIIVGLFAKLL